MLRNLVIAVSILTAAFTVWGLMIGWTWFMVSVFDFWAFTTVLSASAYCLYRWDEYKHRSYDD